jgi:hypothetical protein
MGFFGGLLGNRPPAKEDKPRQFVENLVIMAEQHRKVMSVMGEKEAEAYLETIFDQNDVVFGVPPGGSGTAALKGDALFKQAVASSTPVRVRTSAIPCTREQAIGADRRNRATS